MQYELYIDDILFYGVDEYIDMIILNCTCLEWDL